MDDLEIVSGENGGEQIRCRYCGQLNQTRADGGQAVCGRCRLPLSDEVHKKFTPKQCPDLYAKLQVACTTLGVDMPELFVQQNPTVNAFTGGVKNPVIVL